MADETNLPAEVAKKPERQFATVYNDQPLFDTARLEHYQRIATGLMYSTMLPPSVQGDPQAPYEVRAKQTFSNLILLLELSDRWKAPIMSVVQTASIVHGKLCFEGKMIQATLEQRLGVELVPVYTGQKGTPDYGIRLYDKDRPEREVEGTVADWQTFDKSGQNPLKQWRGAAQTAQLKYRATREWCRLWEPALVLGIYSDDELADIDSDRAGPVAATPAAGEPAIQGGFTKPKAEEIITATATHVTKDGELVPDLAAAGLKPGQSARQNPDGTWTIYEGAEPPEPAKPMPTFATPEEVYSFKGLTQGQLHEQLAKFDAGVLAAWRADRLWRGGSVPDMTEAETKTLMGRRRNLGLSPQESLADAEHAKTIDAGIAAAAKPKKAAQAAPKPQDEPIAQPGEDKEPAEIPAHKGDSMHEAANFEPEGENEVEAEASWQAGFDDAQAGKPNAPGDYTPLDYSMGYNAGAAQALKKGAAPTDEVLDEGDPIPDAPSYEGIDLETLGYADGWEGKPRQPPRGLVAVQLDAYVKGHAKGAGEYTARLEAEAAAASDPFNIYGAALAEARAWAGIKAALVVLSKSTAWAAASKEHGQPRIRQARADAWRRADTLESEGGEFVDMTLDLTAFRCFIEYEVNPEQIETYWDVLATGPLYQSLDDEKKRPLEKAVRDRIVELKAGKV